MADKASKVRLSKCAMGPGEQAAVAEVLKKEYLGMGEETRALESEIAAYIGGGRSVTCVATGTAALQLAVQGCGIGRGDEVIVPSLTFVSCFQAIAATGATPIACEVLAETATIDLEDAARRITPRTRAIMPIHYASFLPNVDAIYDFARSHNLRVIEDAAHSFGGTRDGAKIGSVGDVLCFSFDGIKNITTGEGGAVVTSDPEVQRIVEDARLLGVERDTAARYRGERSWEFDVTGAGWRYHMSNIFAAIGRVQLKRLDTEFAPRRVALAQQYREALTGVTGLALFDSNLGPVVPHIQPVRILGGQRDRVQKVLDESGIETGLHYKPNHLLTAFAASGVSLPVTERLYEELLTLPLHVDLTADEVSRVTGKLIEAVAA
ncbi:MAG: DegT/DnrJ/EryC1/StrS family aminotransferase [Gemmatimonadaceae bacterium]|nr:DegT/DnrJ/EryC1/StrS family aminotransferase [Gemmatimonadaceae bacterium]